MCHLLWVDTDRVATYTLVFLPTSSTPSPQVLDSVARQQVCLTTFYLTSACDGQAGERAGDLQPAWN